ncbi:MAG: hypothetical protein JST76_01885 [Bacteroidetes bacterium]|nr:hypothetical protein [Bacteroidota bacterium]
MKSLIKAIVTIGFITSISSCKMTAVTTTSTTAKARDIPAAPIIQNPNIADLDVKERKVTGTYTDKNKTEEYAKNRAVYDALEKSAADVLVEPSYTIEHDWGSGAISVTVEGFPATYKNFRNPTTEDSLALGWKVIQKSSEPEMSNGTVSILNIHTQQQQQATPPPDNLATVKERTALPSMDLSVYNRLHKSGSRLLGIGLPMLISGIVIAGCSPLYYTDDYYNGSYNYDESGVIAGATIGSAMAMSGLIMTAVGGGRLTQARHIKRRAQQQDLAFMPRLAVSPNHYSAGLSIKF